MVRIIQSVDRALSILELFSTRRVELSVTEISNELNLNKSTVFGLLKTLLERGYLHQNMSNSKYSLGLKALEIGSNVQINDVLLQKARPYMKNLSEKFDESVFLAIEDNGEVLYIDRYLGTKTISLNSEIWMRDPIYCTGVGKCLLAFMNEDRREKILRNIKFEKRTKNTITNLKDLRKELEIIHNRGYSVDNEEFENGLICVAAPVANEEKGIVAAISVSTLTVRFDFNTLNDNAAYLVNIAKELEYQI